MSAALRAAIVDRRLRVEGFVLTTNKR